MENKIIEGRNGVEYPINDKWVVIDGYPQYEISESGIVRRIKSGKIINEDQYGRVQLCCNGKRSMVKAAELFKENITKFLEREKEIIKTRKVINENDSKEVKELKERNAYLEKEYSALFNYHSTYIKRIKNRYESWDPCLEEWLRDGEADAQKSKVDYFIEGLPTDWRIDNPYIDNEDLIPRYNPYNFCYLGAEGPHIRWIRDLIMRKYKSLYERLLETAKPYMENVKNNVNYIDSQLMIHYIGCTLWVVLMTDKEYAKKISHIVEP